MVSDLWLSGFRTAGPQRLLRENGMGSPVPNTHAGGRCSSRSLLMTVGEAIGSTKSQRTARGGIYVHGPMRSSPKYAREIRK